MNRLITPRNAKSSLPPTDDADVALARMPKLVYGLFYIKNKATDEQSQLGIMFSSLDEWQKQELLSNQFSLQETAVIKQLIHRYQLYPVIPEYYAICFIDSVLPNEELKQKLTNERCLVKEASFDNYLTELGLSLI